MDRRIVKTKKRITGAFIELLEKYSRDRIRVKDICEHAKINKTTFYKHYVDSDELATEIDDTVTDRVVDGFPERGELLSEPEAYVEGLSEAIERETDKLTVVYRGRVDFLCAKLEAKLRKFYDLKEAASEKRIMLSFAISGVVRVLVERTFTNKNERCDKKVLSKYLMNMIRKVIPAT